MRPRSLDRGESTSHAAGPQPSPGFNEAAVVGPRRGTESDPTYGNVTLLQ